MSRAKTTRNLYDQKAVTFSLDGIWKDVLGAPETNGAWLIWGPEKNGKTWFALMLADYLSRNRLNETGQKVLFVSAEEGCGPSFASSCKRAGIPPEKKRLIYTEYEPLEEIHERLKKGKSPRIVFIDNMTIYQDELKNGAFRQLLKSHSKTLFIFLAHEERGEPYTATAKLCRKLAKVIVHVKGLACEVSGRCPGGRLVIDEEKAALYHGHHLKSHEHKSSN